MRSQRRERAREARKEEILEAAEKFFAFIFQWLRDPQRNSLSS